MTVGFVNGTLILDLSSPEYERGGRINDVDRKSGTHILGTVDGGTLEFAPIKLFYRGFQVGAIFEFHKPGQSRQISRSNMQPTLTTLPFAVMVAASLGVDHIDLCLTRKVFQILWRR